MPVHNTTLKSPSPVAARAPVQPAAESKASGTEAKKDNAPKTGWVAKTHAPDSTVGEQILANVKTVATSTVDGAVLGTAVWPFSGTLAGAIAGTTYGIYLIAQGREL